jgi:hypothetical protein
MIIMTPSSHSIDAIGLFGRLDWLAAECAAE